MTPHNPAPNDDADFEPEELAEAADDVTQTDIAPELDPATKDLTDWDDPPASHGTMAPKITTEDEANIAIELVGEGLDEADREQRIAAADPDFEP